MEQGKGVSKEQVETLEAEIAAYVMNEKDSSRQTARQAVFKSVKQKLAELFPEALADEEVESREVKWEDLVPKIAAHTKAATAAQGQQTKPKTEPTETPEQTRARLESENKAYLKKERDKIRKEGFIGKLIGAASAAGLDPQYEDAFVLKFEKEFGIDLSDGESVGIVKGEQPYYLNGAPAKVEDVVSEMFGKYGAFKKTTTQTPDPNAIDGQRQGGQGGQGAAGELMQGSLEDSLMKDMPAMRNFFAK